MNTVAYLAAVLYSLPGLRAYLDAPNVTFDAQLAYEFALIIVAGGAMCALEDIGLLGDYAVLFITPSIYFVVTGVTVLALGVGRWLVTGDLPRPTHDWCGRDSAGHQNCRVGGLVRCDDVSVASTLGSGPCSNGMTPF